MSVCGSSSWRWRASWQLQSWSRHSFRVGEVSQLFSERAALEQDYDTGRFGRFGRYGLGADIALEHPLGIGPLQFWLLFVEDPHNSFLNAFLSGGRLAGFCYLALAVVTIVVGERLLVRTPWQPIYHAIYAAYVGTIAESAIIDIDRLAPLLPYPRLVVGFDGGFAPVCCRSAYHYRHLAPASHCLNGGSCRLLGSPWSCARSRASVDLRRIGGA